VSDKTIHPSNEHFERWADTYEDSYMQALIFDRVHQSVLDLVPGDLQPENILDVGCGTGRLLRRLGQQFPQARLNGVDLAEEMIAQANRLTPGARFYVGQAETLPLPDASVDLVLSTMSFHHWADQVQGIRQVARVLRPGGVFILADAIMPYWLWWIFRHGQHVSARQRGAMFAQAGLAMQSEQREFWRHLLISVGKKTAPA
jgi:ubiquinone/menaquinone biosynthesis C-methylase UbiE